MEVCIMKKIIKYCVTIAALFALSVPTVQCGKYKNHSKVHKFRSLQSMADQKRNICGRSLRVSKVPKKDHLSKLRTEEIKVLEGIRSCHEAKRIRKRRKRIERKQRGRVLKKDVGPKIKINLMGMRTEIPQPVKGSSNFDESYENDSDQSMSLSEFAYNFCSGIGNLRKNTLMLLFLFSLFLQVNGSKKNPNLRKMSALSDGGLIDFEGLTKRADFDVCTPGSQGREVCSKLYLDLSVVSCLVSKEEGILKEHCVSWSPVQLGEDPNCSFESCMVNDQNELVCSNDCEEKTAVPPKRGKVSSELVSEFESKVENQEDKFEAFIINSDDFPKLYRAANLILSRFTQNEFPIEIVLMEGYAGSYSAGENMITIGSQVLIKGWAGGFERIFAHEKRHEVDSMSECGSERRAVLNNPENADKNDSLIQCLEGSREHFHSSENIPRQMELRCDLSAVIALDCAPAFPSGEVLNEDHIKDIRSKHLGMSDGVHPDYFTRFCLQNIAYKMKQAVLKHFEDLFLVRGERISNKILKFGKKFLLVVLGSGVVLIFGKLMKKKKDLEADEIDLLTDADRECLQVGSQE